MTTWLVRASNQSDLKNEHVCQPVSVVSVTVVVICLDGLDVARRVWFDFLYGVTLRGWLFVLWSVALCQHIEGSSFSLPACVPACLLNEWPCRLLARCLNGDSIQVAHTTRIRSVGLIA